LLFAAGHPGRQRILTPGQLKCDHRSLLGQQGGGQPSEKSGGQRGNGGCRQHSARAVTSRISVVSRQPKLRRVASSAARSLMFRNITSTTLSTPRPTVTPTAT